MKRLRVGVIGCGVMGAFHLKQYRSISEVEVVGVSDIDASRAQKDVPFFKDYHDIFDLADAVSITTPTSTHFEIGMAALAAECHVLIEKPISMTTDQAEMLISKAKEKRLVLAVGHIERFNPAYMAIIKALGKKKPDIIDLKRLSPFPERITDVSVVIDMMVHDIDLARHIAGSEVKFLNATGKTVRSQKLDQVLAVIVFENGVVANIEASRVHDSKVRKITLAYGKAVYEADLLAKTAKMTELGDSRALNVTSIDQLNHELKDFILAIKNNKRPSVTGEDGKAALMIATKIEEAASISVLGGNARGRK